MSSFNASLIEKGEDAAIVAVCHGEQVIQISAIFFRRFAKQTLKQGHFLKSVPKTTLFDPFLPDEKLLEPGGRGSGLERFIAQMGLLLRGGREGGFFIMIGKKKKGV